MLPANTVQLTSVKTDVQTAFDVSNDMRGHVYLVETSHGFDGSVTNSSRCQGPASVHRNQVPANPASINNK